MSRLPLCVSLALVAFAAARGERMEAVYREGVAITLTEEDTVDMETDEVHVSVNGMELPPEAFADSGVALPSVHEETTLRMKDVVLEATDGRPSRVRRLFEELRERSVENGEEKEQTGPLEGRQIVLADHDGEVEATLDDDGPEVESRYLEGYRLTNNADLLLPDHEVAVGDSWEVDEEAARVFCRIGSGPVFFEQDDDLVAKLIEEESEIHAEVRFADVEERDGVRCARLEFRIELRAQADDPRLFGEIPDGAGDVTATLALEVESEGKLWYSIEEGRPVAMEHAAEGGLDCELEMVQEEEGVSLKVRASGSVEGDTTCRWSRTE